MPRSAWCSSWRPCPKWACRPCASSGRSRPPVRGAIEARSNCPRAAAGRRRSSPAGPGKSWRPGSSSCRPREGCNVLARWMAWCTRNRFFVFSGTLLLLLGGIWALGHLPLDALPDISDVQVVLRASWPGEPPTVIEDQLTYPLVTALRAVPRVQQVRAQTMYGDAFIYVVFQDWFLRYQLETVPGVAEVASIGGFVRQYQVRLDPDRLRAYNIPLGVVLERVRNSVNEVG